MIDKRITIYDKCFKDKQGQLALTQQTNVPIIVAVISAVPALLLPEGVLATIISFVSFGAFFTWAWLEIFDGINYFRRALGGIVMIALFIVACVRVSI